MTERLKIILLYTALSSDHLSHTESVKRLWTKDEKKKKLVGISRKETKKKDLENFVTKFILNNYLKSCFKQETQTQKLFEGEINKIPI